MCTLRIFLYIHPNTTVALYTYPMIYEIAVYTTIYDNTVYMRIRCKQKFRTLIYLLRFFQYFHPNTEINHSCVYTYPVIYEIAVYAAIYDVQYICEYGVNRNSVH